MTSTTRALHLLALCAFAVAQPPLGLLGRNGQFFVAHTAGPGAILTLLVGILILPPLILTGIELLVSRLSLEAANLLHSCFVGGLLFLLALTPIARGVGGDGGVASLIALVLAGAGVWLYRKSSALQGLLSMMAAVPLVFAALFLANDDIWDLMTVGAGEPASSAAIKGEFPIVMVVFDELPVSSLLDRDGEIDAIRYPGFAELARQSTWYPLASSISDHTTSALPAIVTGNLPEQKSRLPIRSNFPDNLFSWLDGPYRVHAIEPRTLFHIADSEAAPDTDDQTSIGLLFTDVGIVTLHLILPASMRAGVPQISRTWGEFAGTGGPAPVGDPELQASEEKRRRQRSRRLLSSGEARLFRGFVRHIEEQQAPPGDSRPLFHFLHTDLPHGPWHLQEDGANYSPVEDYGLEALRWPREPWWSMDAFRRHLLQLAVADQLLGELLAGLRRAGIYDECLLVVVADHGAGFWPSNYLRSVDRNPHPEDLIQIPLFIKRPGQVDAKVDLRTASIIDIVPTIAELLGAQVPWPTVGCSLVSKTCEERSVLKVFARQKLENVQFNIASMVLARTATRDFKIAAFGDGSRPDGLYNVLPYAQHAGRPTADFTISEQPIGKLILHKVVRRRMEQEAARVPARLVGLIEFATSSRKAPPLVAIAVNQEIATLVPAPPDSHGDLRVSAMLPPAVQEYPASALRAYVLSGTRLLPLAIE